MPALSTTAAAFALFHYPLFLKTILQHAIFQNIIMCEGSMGREKEGGGGVGRCHHSAELEAGSLAVCPTGVI